MAELGGREERPGGGYESRRVAAVLPTGRADVEPRGAPARGGLLDERFEQFDRFRRRCIVRPAFKTADAARAGEAKELDEAARPALVPPDEPNRGARA